MKDAERKAIMDAVVASLSEGTTNAKACRAAGIPRSTFWRWVRKYKDFEERVSETRIACIGRVEDALYQKALDGDTPAMIHWLRCRDKKNWEPNPTYQIDVTSGGEPLVTMAAIRAEMAKQIESEQQKALPEPDDDEGEVVI